MWHPKDLCFPYWTLPIQDIGHCHRSTQPTPSATRNFQTYKGQGAICWRELPMASIKPTFTVITCLTNFQKVGMIIYLPVAPSPPHHLRHPKLSHKKCWEIPKHTSSQRTNQLTNQLTNQATIQPTKQTSNQPSDQPAPLIVDQPAIKSCGTKRLVQIHRFSAGIFVGVIAMPQWNARPCGLNI